MCDPCNWPRNTCCCVFKDSEIPEQYFLRDEVAFHNTADDLWIIVNDVVYNLTHLIQERKDSMNPSLEYLIQLGGKDLSSFFDRGNHPIFIVSPISGHRIVKFPPALEVEQSNLYRSPNRYWWEDPFYIVGHISKQERRVYIINALTGSRHLMRVCEEDTINDIKEKYNTRYNFHGGSYTWRKSTNHGKLSGKLDMNGNLTANCLFKDQFDIPVYLYLYYNDDFREA